ncbi:MAG: hypothetical protein V3T58_04600 [Candidatus Hydrothermarchaeales archaeon]
MEIMDDETEKLFERWKGIIQLLNNENTLIWTKFGSYLIVNSILITALTLRGEFNGKILVIVSAFGLVIGIGFLLAICRGWSYIGLRIKQAKEIENRMEEMENNHKMNFEIIKKKPDFPIKTSHVMYSILLLMIIGWVVLFYVGSINLCKCG